MSTFIADLFTSMKNLRQDFKKDWKEDAKKDWRQDWAVNAPVAPTVTTAPSFSGSAVVGQTVTIVDGVYAGDQPITVTYDWQMNGVSNGTTANSYTFVSGDSGQTATCVVTATNSAGSVSSTVTVGAVS